MPGGGGLQQLVFALALHGNRAVARGGGQILRRGIRRGELAVRLGPGALLAGFTGRELKANVALLCVQHKEGIEGTVGARGDKARDELALALRQYAAQLLLLNVLTENVARHGEPALACLAALVKLRNRPLLFRLKHLELSLTLHGHETEGLLRQGIFLAGRLFGVIKVELRLPAPLFRLGGNEAQPRLEGFAELGAEALHDRKLTLGDELLQLFIRKAESGMHAAQAELAGVAGDGVHPAAKPHRPAGRAGNGQVGVLAVFHIVAHGVDNFRSVGADVLHERAALQLAVLHLLQAVLPVARELGAAEGGKPDFAQQVNEVHAAAGGNELLAIAHNVLLRDEPFDDGGARSGGTQPALLHGVGELVVLHQLAGGLHGGEQGGFRVSGRGLGLVLHGLCADGAHRLPGGHGGEFLFLRLGGEGVESAPPGLAQHAPM